MDKKIRTPYLWEVIVAIIILISVLSVSLGILHVEAHVPFLIVIALTSIMTIQMGYTWQDIQKAIINSLGAILQALIILIMVGIVIGTWIQGGIVPSLVYYGLKLIQPSAFLVTIFLVCSICAVATGSSWTIIGTLGVAAMGISQGLQIPLHITAGVVVSAGYFGDKLSPLSDTPNLHCAIVGTNLFDNFKNIFKLTIPSYIISLLLCAIVGSRYKAQSTADLTQIHFIMQILSEHFIISPWLILPVFLVFIVILLKVPAIPSIMFMAVSGSFCSIFVQKVAIADVMQTAYYGYVGNTGVELVDSLLTRGGLLSMMSTVLLIICAVSYGGVLEKSGMLKILVSNILIYVKKERTLILVTVISCIIVNIVAMDNYVTAVICTNMFKDAYAERGLSPLNLSRCLAESASVVSPLIPWNTCGIVVKGMLGISAVQYAPYAFLCWIAPLMVVVLTYLKIGLVYLPSETSTTQNKKY